MHEGGGGATRQPGFETENGKTAGAVPKRKKKIEK